MSQHLSVRVQHRGELGAALHVQALPEPIPVGSVDAEKCRSKGVSSS
jgi:hypothetical protein